jgi:hypothetical protein
MIKKIENSTSAKKIFFLLFLVFAASINTEAQLLKKLKDKANEKINQATKTVTKKVENTPEKVVENAVDKVETKATEKVDNNQKKVDSKVNTTVDKVDNIKLKKKAGDKTSDTTITEPTKKEKKQAASNTEKTNAPKPVATTISAIKGYPRNAINFNSTTPFTVPNAWGPFIDAEGNRYGFHKGYDIYKVSPDGTTTLYFSNKENKNPLYTEGVMDADGNFYFPVMEKNGRGIVKLTKEGQLQHLAGNGDTYFTIADGNCADSKIFQVDKMKYLSDGNIYFTEEISKETKFEGYTGEMNLPELGRPTIIRKLTPDGELSTLKDKNDNIFIANNITDFTMDKDGNIVYAGGFIYKLIPGGEITKLLGTPDPFSGAGEASGPNKQRWVMGDVSKAKVPWPAKLFYNAKNELIIWSDIVRRFAKFDGKMVTAFSGTNDMSCFNKNICGGVEVKADKDGTANTAEYKIIKDIKVEGDDIFLITYEVYDLGYWERALSVRKLSKDGSVKTMMTTTTDIFFKK